MPKNSSNKQQKQPFFNTAKNFFLEIFVPVKENNFLPDALKSQSLFLYSAALLAVKITLIAWVLILPTTNFFSAIAVDRLMTLINQERQTKSLPTLALNTSLNSVADLKVNDMLTKDYFEHTSPSGVTPWYWFKKIGYSYAYAGENLARGFTETDKVFQAWMNSPSHRDNILNPNFQEMGLAVKSGELQSRTETLAVLVFGRPVQTAKAPAAPALAKTAPRATPKITLPPSPAKTPAPATPKPTVAPGTPLPTALSPSPIIVAENLELESILGVEPMPKSPDKETLSFARETAYTPRILGAFVSKSDEIFKSLYLYFALFMTIALLVNIFVKIQIQYWPTIFATTFVILLSTALIFI